MATVTVATAAKVLEVEDNSIVALEVNETGHLIATNGAGDEIDVGAVSGETPDASVTVKGVVELATNAETAAGTDINRAITPAALASVLPGKQDVDADLTAIAGLTPANDDVIQRKGGAWVNRTMEQLAVDLLATGDFAGGGSTTYVPFKTVGPIGSGADYIVDGTADNVQIQAALDSLTTGGVVLLAPGTYAIATAIAIAGNDTYDAPTKALVGAGMHSTTLVCANNINGISLTSCASVVVKDLGFRVTGTGSGIVSTIGGGTPALYQAFWNSQFENLYFARNGGGAHTGWALNMGSPFRSRFANLEVFDLHNGFRFYSQNAAFNPGDFTMDRAFVELDNATGSIGLHLDAPVSGAAMNQMTFNMCEFIDNATGGTAILLNGTGKANHNMFWGINIEQFATVLNVDIGTGNRFDFNYVESIAAGTFFKFGAGSDGNDIRGAGMVYVGTKTNTVINDANTWVETPNTFQNFYLAIETGGVANATISAGVTQISGMRGYNDGTLASVLSFQRQLWNPAPVTLTDASTIITDVQRGSHFRVTLGGNRTLGAPTNPYDGQKVIWEIIQDGTGSRTLTLATGAGAFIFGTDITSITLTTTANKTDFLAAIYNSTANRWRVMAFTKGF